MAFVEVRFPEWAENISGGGLEWATVRTTVRSGAEVANALWEFPRSAWVLDNSKIRKAEFDDLVAFAMVRVGPRDGFRFKDPRDYLIGRSTLDGVTFTEASVATVQLTTTTFQIVRPYTFSGVTASMPVYKINGTTLTNTVADETNSTVRVYQADGTTEVTSGWTVNLTNGVITFSVAPGYVPKVSCEFDFPVRFDADTLPTEYNGFVRGANGVRLRQIKQL